VHRQLDLYTHKDWLDIFPDIFKYEYPEIWAGNISGCTLSTGKCMDVPFTDVGDQECVNWDCADTQVQCPPKGYETCPGWDGVSECECLDPPDVRGDDPKCDKRYVLNIKMIQFIEF
jgi:hypothetical protein